MVKIPNHIHVECLTKQDRLIYIVVPFLGADINLQSSSGRTPLLEAINGGQYNIAEVLIEAGADLDIVDTKGSSVLHHLCFDRRPQLEFVKYVLTSMYNYCIFDLKTIKYYK